MQIGDIAQLASSSTQWTSAQPQSKPATSTPSVIAPEVKPAVPAKSSAPAVAAGPPAPVRSASSASLIESSASSAEAAAVFAASYSTTVAGKAYSASVEESGETYTASTPSPPGVSASGSSIESAEINLDIVLDTLA